MEKNNKKFEIDLLNIFFCVLVVFIHIASEPIISLQKDSWQYLVVFIPHKLSSFVVYGFIMLSGIKLALKGVNNVKIKDFYANRIKKILIPYWISEVIYYLFFICMGYIKFEMKEFIIDMVTGRFVAHFYFVVIITQFYLLLPLWNRILEKYKPTCILIISFLITVLSTRYLGTLIDSLKLNSDLIMADRIFSSYLFWWVLGIYIGKYYNQFIVFLNKYKNSFIISFLGVSIVYIIINLMHVRDIYSFAYLDVLQIIYVTVALMFLYMLAVKLKELRISNNKMIKCINENSFYIYLYHIILIYVFNGMLKLNQIVEIDKRFVVKLLGVYGIIFVFSFVKGKITSLNKFSKENSKK